MKLSKEQREHILDNFIKHHENYYIIKLLASIDARLEEANEPAIINVDWSSDSVIELNTDGTIPFGNSLIGK